MAQFNGTPGNDTLVGTLGADRLVGRAGNDTYTVNHVDDEVVERRNEGTDLVLSSVNYRLPGNVEALMLVGSAALSGTGNGLNNILIGNNAANRLDGAGGADFMLGGGGDDAYVVDNAGDTVMEGSEQGTDTVESSVSYTLGGNVENLALTGSSAISGTGNGLDNLIVGNAAANSLSGGGGDDTLVGSGGNDTLIGGGGFDTAVYSGSVFDYTIAEVGSNFSVTDLRAGAPAGIDTAISVEALRFSDFTVSLNSNNAPRPFDDAVSTTEDTPLVISAASLLSNDWDFEGSTLSVVAVSNGSHGTAVLNGNGTITYTPTASYNGGDSFTYTVSDGTLQSTGTVNVAIAGVNSAPVAVDDSAAGSEDTAMVTGNVLANDSDAESILTPASIVGFGQGANGAVAYNGDGTFTYTPDLDYNGPDSFTYTISDGALTSIATVDVTVSAVNDAPIAANDEANGDEDTPITTENVLDNDSDVDGALTATSVSGFTQAADGVVVYNGDGTFTYTPNANHNGTDSFTYTISDGALTSTATVAVTVEAVNDAPVAANDSASGDEDTPITTGNVLANDTDVDDTLTVASVSGFTQGAHGAVVYNGDGTFTYTPNLNYNGPDSFTYTISDGVLTSTATVDVTVNSVNDAPVADDDAASGDEDTSFTTGNVLDNDSDVDDALTPASISGFTQGAHGTVVHNGDGTFTYTPYLNYSGGDSFTYTISDGALTSTATVNVTIDAVNDAPVAANDSVSGDEDTPITTGNVLANDTDVDTALNATNVIGHSQGANGVVTYNDDGTFIYAPNADFNGSDSFTYTISDGALSSTATVDVTVNAVNDAPIAENDSASGDEDTSITTGNVLDNDSDVDDTLTVASVSGFTNGANGMVTYNNDGTFTYVPELNFAGADSFTYTVFDGAGGVDTATVNVTVAAVNDAAIVSGQTTGSVTEDATLSANGDIGSTDVDGIDDAWQAVTPPAASANGYGTFTIDATGHWTYLLDNGHSAVQALGSAGTLSDSFIVATTDGTQQTVSITIHGTHDNQPPVAVADTNSGDAVVEATTRAATSFPNVNLDQVGLGNGGFKIVGEVGVNYTGLTVAGLRDVNGDARADLLVGAPGGDAAYVVFGKSDGGPIELANIAAGNGGGFKIVAESGGDHLADGVQSVSSLGDVNGDGRTDFLVGAYSHDGNGSDKGAAYVVFGTADSAPISLASVATGAGGYKIIGENAGDQIGYSVSAAGDVNKDGRQDFVIGTFNGEAGDADDVAAYVVYGKTGAGAIDLDQVASGVGGFRIFNTSSGDASGRVVSGAGDVNKDGFADVLIGAPLGPTGGAAYVVFGKSDGNAVNLDALGSTGFKIEAQSIGNNAGVSLASLGDINGDGRADVIVGADGVSDGAPGAGAVYVVFGKDGGASVDLDHVAGGVGGFKIIGEPDASHSTGSGVSTIGDINGDGLPELLIGAVFDDAGGFGSGAAYVVFGKSTGTPIQLSDVAMGKGGFKIFGTTAGGGVGKGVSGLGDVNGDGTPDVLVGAYANNGGAGAAYVIFSPTGNNPGDPLASGNVLTNDSDADLDILTVVGVQANAGAGPLSGGVGTIITGTYGKLTLDATGAYTYTLDNDFPQTKALVDGQIAQDIFSYTIADASGGTATSTLTISISGRNDDPAPLTLNNMLGGGGDATLVSLDADLGMQPNGPISLTDDLLHATASNAIV